MALNKFMHLDNIYKDRKPDFKNLAIKYPEFRKHAVQDLKGSVHLDFKKPECLRALTWALLKEDFSLEVEIPEDRLIPTIPLRLNYLLWLKDLLKEGRENISVTGIDIGTGATCVYPLLGASQWKWKFLATEVDPLNFEFALKNVEKNNLQSLIKVVLVGEKSCLSSLMQEETEEYDFVMCNPPFFSCNLEAWGHMSSRKPDRPEANSVNTASDRESICPGGEVEFVRKMITESITIGKRVRVYSSMLGKKSSLGPLKDELRKKGIMNFGTTEFCQGRTMRWGLGWTFHDDVKFPLPPSKVSAKSKVKSKPMIYTIPHELHEYSVTCIGSKVMSHLDELKVVYEPESSNSERIHLQLAAVENTWSHQRRKRRQKMQKISATDQPPVKILSTEDSQKNISTSLPGDTTPNSQDDKNRCSLSDESTKTYIPEKDYFKTEEICFKNDENETSVNVSEEILNKSKAEDSSSDGACGDLNSSVCLDELTTYLFKADLIIMKCENDIQIQMNWIDGENRELMHQLLQYFKNRIK